MLSYTYIQDVGVCNLWKRGICPFAEGCKFLHDGEGGCAPAKGTGKSKKKCFAFRKGNCEKGADCAYIHTEKKAPASKVGKVKGVCDLFMKKKRCKRFEKGTCKYSHPGSTLKQIDDAADEKAPTAEKRGRAAMEEYAATGTELVKKKKKAVTGAEPAKKKKKIHHQ